MLAEGVELAREITARPELGDLLGEEVEPGIGRPRPRDPCASVSSTTGTRSARAPGHRLRRAGPRARVDGLVVADASLFPQTPRATTNIPTLVAAARVAEWIIAG